MTDAERYYKAMLNGIYGLLDDLDANHAPESAKELLREVADICRLDFEERYGND